MCYGYSWFLRKWGDDMSILIKGMEMPKNCGECLLATLSPTGESLICNYMLSRVSWEERPFDCPLVSVPPHGRLIDADELEEHDGWLRDSMYFAQESCHTHIQFIYANDIINAPTIIEAEDDE